jgi:hypothetical protein
MLGNCCKIYIKYLEFRVENLILFYTEIELKTTKNSGGNMYESFGWIGIQLSVKYMENFDVSSESASICTVSVCIHRT